MSARLLVGGYTDEPLPGMPSGIAQLRLDGGCLVPDGEPLDVASPSYLIRHPTRPLAYAVSEADSCALITLTLDPLDVHSILPIPGSAACHLALLPDLQHLVVACYGDGTIVSVRLDDEGYPVVVSGAITPGGTGPHQRQRGPHAHHVLPIPDGTVWVTDLGADVVRRIHLDADGTPCEAEPALRLPAGTGPRQARVRDGQAYVLGELSGELLTFAEGRLVDRRPAWLTEPASENLPAHLLLDGNRLYASHRGLDRVAVFDISKHIPEPATEYPTGAWPRHIAVHDGWLYTADQYDDRITARKLGEPQAVIRSPMRRASCVLVIS